MDGFRAGKGRFEAAFSWTLDQVEAGYLAGSDWNGLLGSRGRRGPGLFNHSSPDGCNFGGVDLGGQTPFLGLLPDGRGGFGRGRTSALRTGTSRRRIVHSEARESRAL